MLVSRLSGVVRRGRAWLAQPADPAELRRLTVALEREVDRHALSWEDFRQLFRHHLRTSPAFSSGDIVRMEKVAEVAITEGQVPSDLRAFRMLLEELTGLLD